MFYNRRDILHASNDLMRAIGNHSIWMALGWNDLRSRYNRSKLGAFWAGLSMLIFVSALGPIYASLMAVPLSHYMLHLLLGFIIWNYVSGIIMESGREFINGAHLLISFQLGYFTLLMRVVWRNFVVLLYQMMVFLILIVVLQHDIQLNWFIVPFALLAITLNALWMGVIMSVFATRFRDLSELVNNIMRLVFFVTPIIWMPMENTELVFIATWNPFNHLIEIFRAPLATGEINGLSWIIAIVMFGVGWAIAFPLFAKFRSRIAFWL